MSVPDEGHEGAWRYDKYDYKPVRTQEMRDQGQLWVWMNGPGGGHWAVRGTGAL